MLCFMVPRLSHHDGSVDQGPARVFPTPPIARTLSRSMLSSAPPVERAPGCLNRHEHQVPADRPHTLAALYRVRNNLFHGQKATFRPRDEAIVKDA